MEVAVAEQFLANPRALHEEADVEGVGHAHAAMHLHTLLSRQPAGGAGLGLGHRHPTRRRGTTGLRGEIWLKLWGNLTFNPVSALTHATLAGICRFPLTRELAAGMMREAQAVAEKLGARMRVSIDKRIAGAEAVGEHKTSMLQDVERGRALELDALLGSVVELAWITGTETPRIDAIYACASLLAATLAEQQGRLEVQPAK